MTWERVKDATQSGREQINRGATIVVDKVQEATGLKLKETLGWQQKKTEALGRQVETTKDAIVEKLAEKVHQAERTAQSTEDKIVTEAKQFEKKAEEKVGAAEEKVKKTEDVVKSLVRIP